MSNLIQKIADASIDRRKFVGLAAAAGVTASLGLTGCDNKVQDATATTPSLERLDPITGGEWIPIDCFPGSCNFKCYNKAYVVDGVWVRHGPEDLYPDSEDFPQQRPCIKGWSARRIATSDLRLKYPMKRKNWQPGGGENINGHLRGIDEWERISWDEALQYMADEFTRIMDTYGPHSFLATGQSEGDLASGSLGSAILNVLGGCLTTWGQASRGGFPIVGNQMRGHFSLGVNEAQDRMSLRHTKLMVLWGMNMAWMQSGGTMYNFITAKRKSGCKVIAVDPFFNPTHQSLADQWIPCRPGTDGALLEALAHELIINNWVDQEFLDTYCLGYDAEHMPEDAKTGENFKDYILGAYDGQPKTAEWASPICGTTVEDIKDLAQQIGTIKPCAFKSSQAFARTYYGNRSVQLWYTVGWMTGNVGIIGSEVAGGTTAFGALKANLAFGGSGYSWPKNPICMETRNGYEIANGNYTPEHEYGLPFAECWTAVCEGKYHLPGPNNNMKDVDIKCIYKENAHGPANQLSGGRRLEEAFRKVEFVAIHELWMTTDAQYADIVLPVASWLEQDFANGGSSRVHENKVCGRRALNQFYESKRDADIIFALADKLGIGEDVMPRMSIKQGQWNAINGMTVLDNNTGEQGPLLTVTQADLDFYEVEGTIQEGKVPIQDFLKTGYYQIERKDGDRWTWTHDMAFREDPVANPVKTKSGKYEIYCQSLKDYYELACFHDIDALPKYKPSPDGYEDTLQDPEYPFQFMTLHILRQAHSMWYNNPHITELYANDFVMNKTDAEKLGLKKNDWVKVSTSEGSIVRRLSPIPNIMPGVTFLGQGNWRELDQATGVDYGGNVNHMTKMMLLGDAYQAYNTMRVKVEKWSGPEILPDYKKPPVIPLSE